MIGVSKPSSFASFSQSIIFIDFVSPLGWTTSSTIGISLDKFKEDKNLRCIVLRGKGNKSFSAGADISEFKDNRSQEKAVLQYDNVSKNTLNRIQKFSKPIYCYFLRMAYCLLT